MNVLRGEMSLVGPRPERPEFVADLASRLRYYQERHRVKPGLTGWAQLNYPVRVFDRRREEEARVRPLLREETRASSSTW